MVLHCAYFANPFNYLDLGGILCCFLSVFVSDSARWPIVIGLLFLYGRSISYFRLFDSTRLLVRSVKHILRDISPLVLVLIVLILAFAVSSLSSFSPPFPDDPSFSVRLYQGFELLLGNYIESQAPPHYIVIIVLSLAILVVLINVLIAMMTETFLRIYSTPHHHDSKERLGVIIDLESTFRPCCGKKRALCHVAIAGRPEAFSSQDQADDVKELRRLVRKNLRKTDNLSRKLRIIVEPPGSCPSLHRTRSPSP